MLTALVLQLIQCVVALPETVNKKNAVDGVQSDNIKNVSSHFLVSIKNDCEVKFCNLIFSQGKNLDYCHVPIFYIILYYTMKTCLI